MRLPPGSPGYNPDDDPLMTPQEAADYLSVSIATLYTWRSRRRGYGPVAVKVGNNIRYQRSELNRWITANLEVSDEAE